MRIQYHFQQGYADDFSLSILHFVSVRLTDQELPILGGMSCERVLENVFSRCDYPVVDI